jgi:hypothetical protein
MDFTEKSLPNKSSNLLDGFDLLEQGFIIK